MFERGIDVPASTDRVCDRLAEFKERSGRTYEWLARRTHTSKSSVQRYCTGTGMPPTFGMVESIALACGADSREIADLFRLWNRERATDAVAVHPPDPGPGVGDGLDRDDGSRSDGATSQPDRGWSDRGRSGWGRAVSVLAVIALLATVAGVVGLVRGWREPQGRTGAGAGPRPAMEPSLTADPIWTREPTAVPAGFFGVTLNSATGAVPGFRVGAVRLWDSGTRWAQLEPAQGSYDWTVLDRHVDGASRAGLPVLFTFGAAPRWSNPEAPAGPYPDGSRAAPSADLVDWDDAVRAVVTRYAGRIQAYEVWPLGNDARFYNGSLATLVEMTRRASRILRSVDPKATVVCPGMGNLWTADGQSLLRRFAEAGGYDQCDVASIKLYQQKASDPPETMLDLVATVDRLLHSAGVQPRLWVTGTTYAISEQPTLDPALARAYATRYYLTGLYAHPQNVERMYFYSWGGSRLPLVLQVEGSPPTPAALAVDRLQGWLAGAQLTSCGRGAVVGLPANGWQCRFTFPGSRTVVVRWTVTGTARTVAGPQDVAVHDLDGGVVALRPGDPITLTQEPVLVEQRV